MKYSEQIKKLRIDKALSQEELGELSGLSLRTIQRIENGEGNPREDTLALIAKVFEISIDDLISISDDNTPKTEKKNVRIPWFLISSTIIGFPLGLLIGMMTILPFNLLRDGSATIAIFSLAFLFSGLGMFLGAFIEQIFNKKI